MPEHPANLPRPPRETAPATGEIGVSLSVRLCQGDVPVVDLARLRPGSLLEFPTRADAPAELYAGETLVGTGELVDVPGGGLALRVTDVRRSSGVDTDGHPPAGDRPGATELEAEAPVTVQSRGARRP